LRAADDGGPRNAHRDVTDATIAPPRAAATRSVPFLAQYLAQEVIGPDEASPLSSLRLRDAAYRSASASGNTTGILIDA
jgi:hypothetical protein